ncbi:MAG: hypothetical protein LUI04_06125 [Porphyromonadaceae bacterium]|nr:hypothetical protein [Porphyromonadaceae bacterium]
MNTMKDLDEAYYDRKMSSEIEGFLKKDGKYHWLIDYVKTIHKDKFGNFDLDFQTGSSAGKSWFSIYKGTGRIVTIEKNQKPYYLVVKGKNKNGKNTYGKKYFSLTKDELDKRISSWDKDVNKERYYTTIDGKGKKEGYYQTLISRRYSIECEPSDDLLIFDKEFKIGFKDTDTKNDWLDEIKKKWATEIKESINKAPEHNWAIAKEVEEIGEKLSTECDFIGINKKGDLVLLELKRWEDGTKIYLSPVQLGTYYMLTKKFLDKYKDTNKMEKVVLEMLKQKKDLGLINPKWALPKRLSGKIKLAVVVGCDPCESGKDKGDIPSKKVRARFDAIRKIVEETLPDGVKIDLFTCDEKGKLKEL